jgi:hypothetical protein
MSTPEQLEPEARRALLVEYEQCMESYRHTYQTIWQAGALFAAISAAVVAIAAKGGGSSIVIAMHASRATYVASSSSSAFWVSAAAPIPFLFWYLGIFLPMNGYGEVRAERLADIEKALSNGTPGLDMAHYSSYNRSRKPARGLRRLVAFDRTKLRVHEVVNAFCIGIVLIDVLLVVLHIT